MGHVSLDSPRTLASSSNTAFSEEMEKWAQKGCSCGQMPRGVSAIRWHRFNLQKQSCWFDLGEQLWRAEGAAGTNGGPLGQAYFPTVLDLGGTERAARGKEGGREHGSRPIEELGCSSLRGIPLNELIRHLAFYWWVALLGGKWHSRTNSIRVLAPVLQHTQTRRPPNNESLLITSIINSAQPH